MPKNHGAHETKMIPEIQRITELQRPYSSENTPEMKERGRIIRSDLPELLRGSLPALKASIGRFVDDLKIERETVLGAKLKRLGFAYTLTASTPLRRLDFPL